VPIVLKSGSPNLLEPSGPVHTCNGTFERETWPVTLTQPGGGYRYRCGGEYLDSRGRKCCGVGKIL